VALEVADTLKQERLETRVVSMHGLRPLATHTFPRLVKGMKGLFTLEEHGVEGGLGTAISEWIAESGEKVPVFYRFGIRSTDLEFTHDVEKRRNTWGLGAPSIAEAIRFFLSASANC